MTAELSLRHLTTINARFAEGRAESAPEIASTELDDEDDEVEEINDKALINPVISWTRKYVDKGELKVSFNEVVKVRPIPATGKGRSCRGEERLKRRGRWPGRYSAENLESAEKDASEKSNGQGGVTSETRDDMQVVETEEYDPVSTERKEDSATGARSHEPCRWTLYVGSAKSSGKWADVDMSDSDEEEEPRRSPREPREQPDQSAEGNGAQDMVDVCLVEMEEGRRCTKRRSTRDADYELEHFEPVVQPDNHNDIFAGQCCRGQVVQGVKLGPASV